MTERYEMSARWLIMEALMAQLAGSSFDSLTVGAIVRKAGVSRSTFYAHFHDKFDLMDQLTNRILQEFGQHYSGEWRDDYQDSLREMLSSEAPLSVTIELLEHIRRYEHFYRDRYRDPVFVVRLSELLGSRLRLVFQDETYAIFLAYGTVGYIGRWLHEGLQGPSTEVAQRLTNVAKLSMPHFRGQE